MRTLNRGFTLVELLVGLVLLGIVSTAVYRVLVGNQRLYQAQTQRIELQQSIRTAANLLPAEFRELDANDGDIYAMTATSLDLRAMRQLGFLCSAPILPTAALGVAVFRVRRDLFYGARDFDTARDSLLLYYEGDESTRNDDGWIVARPTLIVNSNCPGDGAAAWLITATLVFGAGQVNAGGTQRIQNGSPVRGFVPVRYNLYQSSGRWYVGYDELTDGNAVQPLIGPVTAGGLSFAYYDSTGAVTANRLLVQSIEVRLRAETAQPVHRSSGGLYTPVDSVATRVALRNNRRW